MFLIYLSTIEGNAYIYIYTQVYVFMRLREYSFRIFVSFYLKRMIESVKRLDDVTLLSDASMRIVGRASQTRIASK